MGPSIKFKPLQFDILYHRNLLRHMIDGPSVKSKNTNNQSFEEKYRESMKGCGCCGNRLKALMKCTACGKVSYCSKDCQVQDWPAHKTECKKHRKKKNTENKKGWSADNKITHGSESHHRKLTTIVLYKSLHSMYVCMYVCMYALVCKHRAEERTYETGYRFITETRLLELLP